MSAGAVDGDDIRGLADSLKHDVGVWDNRDKVGGVDDVTAGAVDGDDIRGLQLTVSCKHAMGVCDNGDKVGGEWMMGKLEGWSEVTDIRGVKHTCYHGCRDNGDKTGGSG